MFKEQFKYRPEEERDPRDVALEEVRKKIDFDKLNEELEGAFGFAEKQEIENDPEVLDRFIKAMGLLTVELREKAGEYDAVLSDDASGRLISLILRKVINRERDLEGEEGIPIYFIAGGHNNEDQRQNLRNFVEKKNNEEGIKKVLMVTEYMFSGRSMERLCKILEDLGVEYDIACLSVANLTHIKDQYPQMTGRMMYGEENKDITDIGLFLHHKDSYSGVKKEIMSSSPHPDKAHGAFKVNEAREDIDKISRELFKLLEDDVESE